MSVEQAMQRRSTPGGARAETSPQASSTRIAGAGDLASPYATSLAMAQAILNAAPRARSLAVTQAAFNVTRGAQRKDAADVMTPTLAGPVQRSISGRPAIQRSPGDAPAAASQQNRTGLPSRLKTGIEALSGVSLDHVRVHYNSPQPAQLQAHAFARGSDIHIAPGQQQHLPHEAWHVVQQAQGRVRPTIQLANGVPINDQPGLEREADMMGARAVREIPTSGTAIVAQPPGAGMSTSPIQRHLVVDKVPFEQRKSGFDYRTFDDPVLFRQFVASALPLATPYPDRFWSTPIMTGRLDQVREGNNIVSFDVLTAQVQEALIDAERLDTLDPEGPVPHHRELATFAEPPDQGLGGHSQGPVGYAGKMMGKTGERDAFAHHLEGVNTVILTTGTIADVPESHQWHAIDVAAPEAGNKRRPGLSIINYSDALYKFGGQLAICGVRGKILMDQFGLAIREFAHAKLGKTITIKTIFSQDAVAPNYSRLLNFFVENEIFQQAHTVVFGYASAFEDEEGGNDSELITRQERRGWVGYLFEHRDAGLFAVFDSDLTHSYHGEILAQNVKTLLESPAGRNVTKVLIGGSAGSLVAPKGIAQSASSAESSGVEESLVPNGIYIPEGILRPDGYFKTNALHHLAMKHSEELTTLPGSMHTSVVSVLAETPGVLNDLFNFGVKTVDMEFAYVAMVLGDVTKPEGDKRDLADVKLGVACLVTDFPKTGAHGVALAEKNESAKRATKAQFVRAVIESMK